jgi:hypothetical protein
VQKPRLELECLLKPRSSRGLEYGCLPAPGTQDAYVMTVDVFAFPKVTKSDQIAAQRKLAELMMDPAVQVEFNKFKGSLPARLDADVGSLDACAQVGQKVMAGGEANQLPNFALAFGPDTQGQVVFPSAAGVRDDGRELRGLADPLLEHARHVGSGRHQRWRVRSLPCGKRGPLCGVSAMSGTAAV